MDQRKQIISIFFFALFLFVIYQLLRIFSPFAKVVFWAAILTFAFYPLYQLFHKSVKNRNAAAFLTTFCIFLLVIPPSLFVLSNLVTQTLELYQKAKIYVRGEGIESIIQTILSFPWFQNIQDKIPNSNLLKEYLSNLLLRNTHLAAKFATAHLGLVTKNIFLILFNIFLTVILTFFFLRDGEKIYRFIYELTPLEEKDRKIVFSKINDAFSGVIRGQLITSITQGLLAGLTFFFLRLPAPLFFGFATFVTSTIPITGASTVWVPFTFYLFLTQQTPKAISLAIIGTFVISLSDNLIKPILIGEKTKIPVFLLFLGILGGLHAYGVTGVFLGPVFITLFFALIKIYQDQYSHLK